MKKLVAVLLALLIIVPGTAVVMKTKEDRKRNAELYATSEKTTQLIAKRNILQGEIEDLWDEYNETTSNGMSYVVLFFDNLHSNLISDVYPLLSEEEFGYKGTVVMSDLETPGDDGCISMEEYKMLVDAGWDFAIGTGSMEVENAESGEEIEEYIDNYKKKLDEKGIPMPITFCFDPGEYREEYDDLLWEKGFKVVRHFGENGQQFSRSAAEGRLYHLASGVIRTATTNMKADIDDVIAYEYTYSASVRYVKPITRENNLDCTRTKYENMLDYLDDTNVLTASELYDEKIKALSNSGEYVEEFNAKLTEMEERLDEINAEIKELVK